MVYPWVALFFFSTDFDIFPVCRGPPPPIDFSKFKLEVKRMGIADHSKEKDPRPKRRIDKDNPYRLFTVGVSTSEPHYFIQFKDGAEIEHCLEIEKPLFDLFDQFELDDLSYMNEVDNHYEHSELTEASLRKRAVVRPEDVEAVVLGQMDSEQLLIAILVIGLTQQGTRFSCRRKRQGPSGQRSARESSCG